jgi:hypothetical protein
MTMRNLGAFGPGGPTPSLPYAGTSGWSGSDASRERAEERDRSGKTATTQQMILDRMTRLGPDGQTIKDLREAYRTEHHGTLSGALTALHKAGRIARLTEKRDRCSIYVAPEFVNGRETVEPKRPWEVYGDLRARADAAEENYNNLVEDIRALVQEYETDAAAEGYGGELWSTTAARIAALLPDGDER